MQVFTTLKLPEVNSYSELLFFFYHTPLPDGTPTITVLLNFFFVAKNQLAFICSILRFSSSKLPTWAECCRAELKCRCQTDLLPSPPRPGALKPFSRCEDFLYSRFHLCCVANGWETQRSRALIPLNVVIRGAVTGGMLGVGWCGRPFVNLICTGHVYMHCIMLMSER